jgi:transposase
MPTKNKYVNRSRISEAKFRQFLKLFCLDLSATQIKSLAGLNRNTVNRYLNGVRSRIALIANPSSLLREKLK